MFLKIKSNMLICIKFAINKNAKLVELSKKIYNECRYSLYLAYLNITAIVVAQL